MPLDTAVRKVYFCKKLNQMYTTTTLSSVPSFKQSAVGSAAENDLNSVQPRENAHLKSSTVYMPAFRGKGILLRPIPFPVRDNEPTLKEFAIV
mgnify:CR=1 FL=1